MTSILQMFKESKITGPRVFLDMDGVLVNWNKGYIQTLLVKEPDLIAATGYDITKDTPHQYEDKLLQYYLNKGENPKKAKSKAKGRFWKPIHGDYEWWVNLEWMPDGKDLFNYCLNLRQTGKIRELNILSSPSSDNVCEQGKRAWLDKHGVTKDFDRIIIFKDKYKFCEGPLDILVDDTPKKTTEWANISNGSPVFHTSTANSIAQLEKILGGFNVTSQNDPSSV
jgi:hypothetical protein